MINAVAFVSGGGDGGTRSETERGQRAPAVFFFPLSLTEPVKALAKLFHHGFAFLPCCRPAALSPLSSLSLHTPLSPTHTLAVFARVSSVALRPGALITGPLISAETFPLQLPRLGLSPFTCFPRPSALSHFHLAAPSLPCSVVTTRSCGQLGGGRIDLASRWVSPTEPYGARLMR